MDVPERKAHNESSSEFSSLKAREKSIIELRELRSLCFYSIESDRSRVHDLSEIPLAHDRGIFYLFTTGIYLTRVHLPDSVAELFYISRGMSSCFADAVLPELLFGDVLF
jgi:hypothetical protein